MGRKLVVLGVLGGGILTLTMRPPRKSISTETRYLAQKRCRSSLKCGLQRQARNSIKIKKNKKITKIDLHISPLCRGGPAWPICTIFGVWGHIADVITYPVCQILSRLVKGLGATAPQNRGFPIDFECRSYNSVRH